MLQLTHEPELDAEANDPVAQAVQDDDPATA
jgi:hypothetical protein